MYGAFTPMERDTKEQIFFFLNLIVHSELNLSHWTIASWAFIRNLHNEKCIRHLASQKETSAFSNFEMEQVPQYLKFHQLLFSTQTYSKDPIVPHIDHQPKVVQHVCFSLYFKPNAFQITGLEIKYWWGALIKISVANDGSPSFI